MKNFLIDKIEKFVDNKTNEEILEFVKNELLPEIEQELDNKYNEGIEVGRETGFIEGQEFGFNAF